MSRFKVPHDLFDFDNHVVSAEPFDEWVKRYQLEAKSSGCLSCGETIRTTIPIFSKTIRGLKAPPCVVCGYDSRFQTYILSGAADTPELFKVLGV